MVDTCTHDCVPKCDGKNDTCVTFHGIYALANSEWSYCAKYSDADEQNCPTSCLNEGEIQCFNADNNPLPLKCVPAEKICDGNRDCKTFGEDEENCPTECDEGQWKCKTTKNPYRECISMDKVANITKGRQLNTG